MFKTLGVLNNITNRFLRKLEDQSKKKKSLKDSDDEMIIKNINENK